jgi:tetratricopeptide (TPR) repeat protein
MILHRCDQVEVLFHQGNSEHLLITFGTMHDRADGVSFWAKPVAEKGNVPTIGFMATHPNWFPRMSMEAAIRTVEPILAKYERVLLYGQSMGAYAALKYGRRLRATHVIAFSPQYTINPAEMRVDDARYRGSFQPRLHEGMAITDAESSGHIFVVHDPYYPEDKANVEAIGRAIPRARVIRVPWTQHFPIKLQRGTARALSILDAVLDCDGDRVERLAGDGRRGSAIRLSTVCEAWSFRDFDGALSLFAKRSTDVPTAERRAFFVDLARACMRRKAYDQAARAAVEATALDAEHEEVVHLRFDLACRQGDIATAAELGKQLAARTPADAAMLDRVGGLMLQADRLDEAQRLLEAAICMKPGNSITYRRLARLWARRKEPDRAVEFAEVARTLKPLDPATHTTLSAILLSFGRLAEALEAAEAALRVDPGNTEALMRSSRAQEAIAKKAGRNPSPMASAA